MITNKTRVSDVFVACFNMNEIHQKIQLSEDYVDVEEFSSMACEEEITADNNRIKMLSKSSDTEMLRETFT